MGRKSAARKLRRDKREKGLSRTRSGPSRRLHSVRVRGWDIEGNQVGDFEARIKINGDWLTPRRAKKMLKLLGAVVSRRDNIWEGA